MSVTEWYTIRGVTLPTSWVSVLIAFTLVGIILWWRYGKKEASVYADHAIFFILIWKFSVIVTDLSLVIKQPLIILFFNGGTMGFYIAIVATCISIFRQLKKNVFAASQLRTLTMAFILTQSVYQIAMAMQFDGLAWQRWLTVVAFIIWLLIAIKNGLNQDIWRKQLIILFSLSHIMIALLQPDGFWQKTLMATFIFSLFVLLVHFLKDKSRKKMEASS
ncbi:hypothetical protein [Viridibacillus sp. FSL H8-0123]|uniref:hypothetical protein n=1 Tax=Viridibacillus sp. FSL H8-0123 TaxID=1928922 RepID=UPI00096D6650|nr:hypothetical protein [Viridibacillus sp. FSL H8-0123]OMC81713.1 hypothetical protein BK130_13675 [Viridibacillus sp. FSL H8-0123]